MKKDQSGSKTKGVMGVEGERSLIISLDLNLKMERLDASSRMGQIKRDYIDLQTRIDAV